MAKKKIVIVGGGFAGVMCANTLRRKLSYDEAEIVLYSQENHLVFQPLLAEVVGSSLTPESITISLRQMLPGVVVGTEEVLEINLAESCLFIAASGEHPTAIPYDHAVIAVGSSANLAMVPGMADHAFPLRVIGDAIELRAHVLSQMERAEVSTDVEERRWLLSFVVVGGGFSGVESAGEINDLARASCRFFHTLKPNEINVSLVHSGVQVLPEIATGLRDFAAKKMRRCGIKLELDSRVGHASARGVTLKDGKLIEGGTIVCTIGGTAAPLVQRLTCDKERGRIITDSDMRIKNCANTWAVGDCAQIVNAATNTTCAPTGQFAERQGRQAAKNIIRLIRGESTKPFYFKPLGQLCSIGGHCAVAEMFSWRLGGFIAWFVWRGVYLFKLPRWSRRIKVGIDWALQLVFPRDLTLVRANTSGRTGLSYFEAGDYIFHERDPGQNFYVIQTGEVEVLKKSKADDADHVIGLIGTGGFFGEGALLEDRPRSASVRARTYVEAVVIGREAFKEMASQIIPLGDLLQQSVVKRAKEIWIQIPAAQAGLAGLSLSDLIDPPVGMMVNKEASISEAIRAFDGVQHQIMFVIDAAHRLCGTLSRVDLLRTIAAGHKPSDSISVIPMRVPVAITSKENPVVIGDMLREYKLNLIPVVGDTQSHILIGFITVNNLLQRLLDSLVDADKPKLISKSQNP